jgi:hypothetical protein
MPQNSPALHQLRFIFERSAPVLRFVEDVTPGDIARIWGAMTDQPRARPVAIDVTFAHDRHDASGLTPAALGWLPSHLAWGRDPEE